MELRFIVMLIYLNRWNGIGDGFSVVGGSAQIVIHSDIAAFAINGGKRKNAGEAIVSFGLQTAFVPLSAVCSPICLHLGNSTPVGDGSTDLHVFVRIGFISISCDGGMQYADGVIGRNLLGDAMDGTAATIESAHVDGVDGITGIGFLQLLNALSVPFFGGHSILDR